MLHRRLHSNTVSGDRPLAIDTTSRPGMPRRNSEGSPGLPPEIDICAATPLESKQENGLDGHLSLEDFPPKNINHQLFPGNQDLPLPLAYVRGRRVKVKATLATTMELPQHQRLKFFSAWF
ncbi:unnamed protein product [Absidia cylindrospora]